MPGVRAVPAGTAPVARGDHRTRPGVPGTRRPARTRADGGAGGVQHLINVCLWPAARGAAAVPSARTRQGYHLLHWATADYTYWAVSDLGLPELGEFAGLLRQADSAAGAPK